MEELGLSELRFVHHYFDALRLDTLHDALDTGVTKIVRAALHNEAVDADDPGISLEYIGGHKIYTGCVGLNDGTNKVLRDITIVG